MPFFCRSTRFTEEAVNKACEGQPSNTVMACCDNTILVHPIKARGMRMKDRRSFLAGTVGAIAGAAAVVLPKKAARAVENGARWLFI